MSLLWISSWLSFAMQLSTPAHICKNYEVDEPICGDGSSLLQTVASANADADILTTSRRGWGPLSHQFCDRAFHEKLHVFHGMWSQHGNVQYTTNAFSTGPYKEKCWEHMQMTPGEYIDAVKRQSINGSMCNRHWNNPDPEFAPVIGGSAMILGNDDDIDTWCGGANLGCASRDMVRLTLGPLQWNMCRNFEFVACGAMGAFVNQSGPLMFFATAPSDIWPDKFTIDIQNAWMSGALEYPNQQIVTLLEMCLLSHMCSNRAELFETRRGQYFRCELDEKGFEAIGALLAGS